MVDMNIGTPFLDTKQFFQKYDNSLTAVAGWLDKIRQSPSNKMRSDERSKINIMEKSVCKNYKTCPIFTGALQGKEVTSKGYKSQYCEAGESGLTKCKRFLVKEKSGKCPPDLLPNSFKSVEEIIAAMQ